MLADSLIFAHTQKRAVHEAYACAFTTKLCSEKCEQGLQAYLLKLSEPIVRNHFWEHIFHIATHFVEVEMLETSVARRMEQNHNQHDLRHQHFFRSVCPMHLGEKRENFFQNSSNLKKIPIIWSLANIGGYSTKQLSSKTGAQES